MLGMLWIMLEIVTGCMTQRPVEFMRLEMLSGCGVCSTRRRLGPVILFWSLNLLWKRQQTMKLGREKVLQWPRKSIRLMRNRSKTWLLKWDL